MKKLLFFFAFLLTANFTFSTPQDVAITSCSAPTNLTVVSQTSSSVSFDWNDCGCMLTEYRVYYTVNGQTSQEYATSSSGISFSGLSTGSYRFYFYTVCGGETSSIIIEDIFIA